MISLSLIFYVKSKLVKLESQNLLSLHIEGLRILLFIKFDTLWNLKFTKLTNFRATKMVTLQFKDFYNIQNDFTSNLEWQGNHEIFTLCMH